MSSYCGDIRLGDTIDIKFTTRQISGAPSTLSGTPVISAYPSNSTTQLTAGITLTVDFDSVTGYNNVRVVASSGNGYATATNYDLCITTGTVNSVSVVGESIGSFSIENRSALMPATAGRTAVVDAAGLIDANAVKVGPTGSGTAQTARDIGASVLLAAGQKVDVDTIKTNPVVNGGTVTFPPGATLAATTDIPTAVQNADALLGRNIAGGSSTGRLVKEALYFLRNKWAIATGTLTVYGTDDTTSAWTASVGTDAAAVPIVSNDPA
jgi:hypothetical protein